MKGEKLYELLDALDDTLVLESAEVKRTTWRRRLALVAAVVAVIAFVVNFVTQPPDPLLYIAGVNMSQEYTEPMEALGRRFVADEGLDSELVTYDANFTITETGVSGGMVDGSVRQRAEDKARCSSANQCIAWTSAGSRASLRAPMER